MQNAGLVACVLMMVAVVAFAAPVKQERTLVTDEQIEAWRNDEGIRNLVMNGDACGFTAAGGHRPAKIWVEKDDQWLWDLLLPSKIRRGTCVGFDDFASEKTGCPEHGADIYKVHSFYPWIVDAENLPGKLKCPIDGKTYPSNDFMAGDMTSGDFPDDGSGFVKDGRTYHFIGLYSHYAYNTAVVPGIRSLSRAYTVTGDRRYAHKAAVLLLKVATEYPNSTDRKDWSYHVPYGKNSGMITDVVWEADTLTAFAYAYDEIFDTLDDDAELLAFAKERVPGVETSADLREYIEEHIFRPGMQALIDQAIRPNAGWGPAAMGRLALLMNDYSDRHPNTADAMEWLYYSEDGKMRYVNNQFYKDGTSYESTSYNTARAGFIEAGKLVARIKALAPTPYDEARYPDILHGEKLGNYASSRERIYAIGRNMICVGDVGSPTAVPQAMGRRKYAPMPSDLMDGYGLGILRDKADEFNAILFYGGLRGHAHYDPLMIGLYAYGMDMLPNIGYPQSWGTARAWEWALSTHQTVTVDRDNAPCSTIIGSMDIWDAGENVQVMEASKRPYRKDEPRGENAPDVTDYRRMVAAVQVGDGSEGYVVDIFRVTGGKDHLLTWRGPYTEEPLDIEGLELTAQAGGTMAGPDVEYGEKYEGADGQEKWDPFCHLVNVAKGDVEGSAAITWHPKTPLPGTLRLNFVPQGELEIIRADGGAPVSPDKNILNWAFAHREGEDGLQSQFVTIVEPYGEERIVREIRNLKIESADAGEYAPIAVEVQVDGGRDIILATAEEESSVSVEGFRLVGRFGLIRERGGRVVEVHLAEGTLLEAGESRIELPEKTYGRIVDVNRETNEIVVEGGLQGELVGRRLEIDNHGERMSSYTIVESAPAGNGRTRLVLDANGILGEGCAIGFEDGFIRNAENVNMPFAGLVVREDGRLDYSDCFHYGAHLEVGDPHNALKVRGIEGFPYQAWGNLHEAGINHVRLVENTPADELERYFAANADFVVYEYGIGDEVSVGHSAHLKVE